LPFFLAFWHVHIWVPEWNWNIFGRFPAFAVYSGSSIPRKIYGPIRCTEIKMDGVGLFRVILPTASVPYKSPRSLFDNFVCFYSYFHEQVCVGFFFPIFIFVPFQSVPKCWPGAKVPKRPGKLDIYS
jgi:hypothetical protein